MEGDIIAEEMTVFTKLRWIQQGIVMLGRYGLLTLQDMRILNTVEDYLNHVSALVMRRAA